MGSAPSEPHFFHIKILQKIISFHNFFNFCILMPKWWIRELPWRPAGRQMAPKIGQVAPNWRHFLFPALIPWGPKVFQKHIRDATSIFHRFGIHFCVQGLPKTFRKRRCWSVSASMSPMSADVSRFRAFHRFASSGQCPWGAAVSLCVYNPPMIFGAILASFFGLFPKMAKVWNKRRV